MHLCVHAHGCTRPYGSELDLCTHGTLWHINVHARSTVPHVRACLAHVCARVVPHGPRLCMHGAPWHPCAPLHQHQGCCQKLLAPEQCHLWLAALLIPPHGQIPLFHPTPSTPQLPALPGRSRQPSSALLRPQHTAAASELVQEHPWQCGSTRCVVLATIWEQGLAAHVLASGVV